MTNIADMSLNDMARKAKETAQETQEKMKTKFNEATDKAEEKLYETTQRVQQRSGEISEAICNYVKDKPLTSVAIAAGIGALLGMLMRK